MKQKVKGKMKMEKNKYDKGCIKFSVIVYIIIISMFLIIFWRMWNVDNIVVGNLSIQISDGVGTLIVPDKVKGITLYDLVLDFFALAVVFIAFACQLLAVNGAYVKLNKECFVCVIITVFMILILLIYTFTETKITSNRLAELKRDPVLYASTLNEAFTERFRREIIYVSEDGTPYKTVYRFSPSILEDDDEFINKELVINDLKLKFITYDKKLATSFTERLISNIS